ncbi:MAG: DUF2085 domain-containing protein [Ignavibacteriales bacterium]|nr:DUF2085 domain-containing protein [Ignavibacteriales bacterium]
MNRKIKLSLFLLTTIWLLLILYQMFLPLSSFLIKSYFIIDNIFGVVCHQQEDKLLTIFGIKTMVCARCTGIYLGMFIGSVYILFRSISKINFKIFIFALLPILFDVIFIEVGLYAYNKLVAFLAGLIFGLILFIFISLAINSFYLERENNK